jgi:hypothetical protein
MIMPLIIVAAYDRLFGCGERREERGCNKRGARRRRLKSS